MIVAARRAWVDPDNLIWILEDDGFQRLQGIQQVEIGDLVVYRSTDGDVSHVGVVLRKKLIIGAEKKGDPLVVLSKWGGDGEYIHEMSDVPALLGSPSEFWTDRKGR
jgi:hypothetical protein